MTNRMTKKDIKKRSWQRTKNLRRKQRERAKPCYSNDSKNEPNDDDDDYTERKKRAYEIERSCNGLCPEWFPEWYAELEMSPDWKERTDAWSAQTLSNHQQVQ